MAIIVADSPPVNRPPLRLIRDEEGVPDDGSLSRREPFAMIPHAVLDEHAAKVGPVAWAVFTALVRHADQDGRCYPSRQRVADLLGIHPNSVSNGIARLVTAGLVVVEKRTTDTGSRASNGYFLPSVCRHTKCEVPHTTVTTPSHLVGPPLTPDVKELEPIELEPENKNDAPLYPPPTKKRTKATETAWPEDFALTDDLREYAVVKARIRPDRVDAVFEDFHRKALAKGYRYVDWRAAWQSWVRSRYQDGDRLPPEPTNGHANGMPPKDYGLDADDLRYYGTEGMERWKKDRAAAEATWTAAHPEAVR